MNKFERTRQLVTWLENNGYEGEVVVKFNGELTVKEENVDQTAIDLASLAKPTLISPIIQGRGPGRPPKNISNLGDLESVDWQYPNGDVDWNPIVLKALLKNGIHNIDQLIKYSYKELFDTPYVGKMNKVIKDGLARKGYFLRKTSQVGDLNITSYNVVMWRIENSLNAFGKMLSSYSPHKIAGMTA